MPSPVTLGEAGEEGHEGGRGPSKHQHSGHGFQPAHQPPRMGDHHVAIAHSGVTDMEPTPW